MGSKLRKIMQLKRSENDDEDREIQLKKYAQEQGVSLQKLYRDDKLDEPELVSRILNAERSQREHRLWIVALVSAIASVLSALAAWFAVFRLIHRT